MSPIFLRLHHRGLFRTFLLQYASTANQLPVTTRPLNLTDSNNCSFSFPSWLNLCQSPPRRNNARRHSKSFWFYVCKCTRERCVCVRVCVYLWCFSGATTLFSKTWATTGTWDSRSRLGCWPGAPGFACSLPWHWDQRLYHKFLSAGSLGSALRSPWAASTWLLSDLLSSQTFLS